jgi:hypothetical protein
MRWLSGKRMMACAAVAGAMLVAGVAVPAWAADDLPGMEGSELPLPPPPDVGGPLPGGPYDEPAPAYPPQRSYMPGRYAPGPDMAMPPMRYERSALERPVLPLPQMVAVLRADGYSPLGPVTQRGWIYTVAALDPDGEDGRLIIDARTGRIMRFIPAMAVGARLNARMAMAYGPPGPPPPTAMARYEGRRGGLLDLRHAPRPPAAVPPAARRTVPKIVARHPKGGMTPIATPAAQPQVTDGKPAAAATVGAARSAATKPAEVKSPEVKLLPTREMPPAQTLE